MSKHADPEPATQSVGWNQPLLALLEFASGIGARPGDTPETRTLKGVMTIASTLAVLNAIYFATVYFGLERIGVAISLLAFAALLAANVLAFLAHGNLRVFRDVSFLFIFAHIVAYHVLLGGYVGSSGYIHYTVVVIVGLHLFFQERPGIWFMVYIATGAALYVAEPTLAARVEPLPDSFRSLAMFNDFVIILCIVYLGVRQFARQLRRERATIRTAYDELARSYEQLEAAQARLVQAEKMASLGRLSSGLAHEIRNPVNFVNNFAEANRMLLEELHERLEESPDVRVADVMELVGELGENVERIKSHGERAEVIVGNMVHHASGDAGDRAIVHLDGLVADSFNIALHSYRARHPDFDVELETRFASGMPEVELSTREIVRVFTNLFDNAFIAMDGSAAQGPHGVHVEMRPAEIAGAPAVRTVIRDTGPGVPEGVRSQIFEPFFTTRAGSAGTGLGLSLAYDIVVEGHGGLLELEPSEAGAQFSVTLPVA